MIRIEVYLPNNDVMAISEALKKIDVGGLTVIKKRGRGKKPPPEIHAGKGSMIFTPQFTEKYVIELEFEDFNPGSLYEYTIDGELTYSAKVTKSIPLKVGYTVE